jgi:hypothetical protein
MDERQNPKDVLSIFCLYGTIVSGNITLHSIVLEISLSRNKYNSVGL